MGMIPFVGNKEATNLRVFELLKLSGETNTYTNNGPVKSLLEKKLEKVLNLPPDRSVFCVNNGTSALHVLMFLCEKNRGRMKWVTPSFTFPSSVVGGMFEVDILDIDPTTYTLPLDNELLEKYEGIILTNLFGSYVDIAAWEKFCTENNKILIFDNASSPLSEYKGKNICTFGDYAFGSLHHTKYLGFGEGGFVVVPKNDYDIVARISSFGFDDQKNFNGQSSNFKMSDVSAAYILSHLENYHIDKHIRIQQMITEDLEKNTNLELFNFKPGTVYGNLPVIVKSPFEFEVVKTHPNIQILKYYKPLERHQNSLQVYNRILNFPLHAALTDKNARYIQDFLSGI